MQMIAAVNMRKAVQMTQDAKPFVSQTLALLNHFSRHIQKQSISHPYLQEKTLERILGIVIASNRGLCGSFHSQLEKKIKQIVQQPQALLTYPFDKLSEEEKAQKLPVEFDWLVIGKKGERMIKKLGHHIIASFDQLNEKVDSTEIDIIFKMMIDEFNTGKYQKVVVFYTRYLSPLVQKPVLRQLLPISPTEVDRVVDEWNLGEKKETEKLTIAGADKLSGIDFLVEPNDNALMETVFRLLLKTSLYHCVITSKASVESARMLAMKNATDAAGEMGEILLLTYNRLRQGKITNEIAEITAGCADFD